MSKDKARAKTYSLYMFVIHRSVVSNLVAMVAVVAMWAEGWAGIVEEKWACKVKTI